MNLTLFRANIKSFWVHTVIIICVLFLYASISVTMFDPVDANNIQELMDAMPEAIINAFGFDDLGTTLTGFVSAVFYGFVIVMFSMIYTIIVSHGLVGKLADNGSMAYLLSTPNTRKKIVTTQMTFLITAITVAVWLPFLLILIMSESIYPGMLNIKDTFNLSMIAHLVITTCAGISFLCSCVFSDAKYSLMFGGGIPVFFLIMNLLQGVDEKVEFVKYFSLYSFLDIEKVMNIDGYMWIASTILIGASVMLYALSIRIFEKKSFIV